MKQHLPVVGALVFGLALLVNRPGLGADDNNNKGWQQLFNGKDLAGWKTHPKHPGLWEVKEGILIGRGKVVSHLFSEGGAYQNFHFRIVAKISDKGNSGQYFRTQFGPGYPKGYEAQISSTFPDPNKTGSLYGKVQIKKMLVPPDTWFTQEVIARGNRIIILVNGQKTVDYVDKDNSFSRGHFAIQQHSPAPGSDESIIMLKKIEVKKLPAGE